MRCSDRPQKSFVSPEDGTSVDGETMKKVIINEASTLLDTVANLKAPAEVIGAERGRVLGHTKAFRFPRKEGEQAWSNHRLHAERLSHGQEALHLIVAPGHKDSIQNMFTGALQADTAHIMVPAAGSFTIDNHKAGENPGTETGQQFEIDHSLESDILRQPGVQHLVQGRSRDIPCHTKGDDSSLTSAVLDCT